MHRLSTPLIALLLAANQLAESFSISRKNRHHSRLFAEEENQSSAADDGIGVGIDLGTTFSAVSILKDGIPIILDIEGNGRTMPSVVSLNDDVVLVGRQAIDLEVTNPLGTYRNVKRIIGTGDKAAREIANVVPNLIVRSLGDTKKRKSKRKQEKELGLTQQILDAQENPAKLRLPSSSSDETTTTTPELISSQILRKLYQTAAQYSDKKVTRAVIGVPAYFHDEQRDATVRASALAGVEQVKLLREPEAAALSYGVGKEQIGQGDMDELVLVFDLGGGTYDVSMLVVGGGLTEVISTSGNACLGGSDWDYRVAQYFSKVLQGHGTKHSLLSISESGDAMVRAAEAVRIYLSNNRKAQLALPLTVDGWASLANARDVLLTGKRDDLTEEGLVENGHVLVELNRKTMETMCKNEFQSLLRPLREVSIMSGAMLPGDTSPSIVEAALELEEEIEAKANELAFEDFYISQESVSQHDENVDPDMVLQLQEMDVKATKRAQQKGRKKARQIAKDEKKYRAEKRKVDQSVSDTKVRSGITGRPISQVVLVGGATRMPAIGRLLAALTGVVPQRTVNPDEAVALGCAVQVGVLDGADDVGGLTVLTPMQAAILRAVAEQQGLLDDDPDFADF